jgi:hypothetical protein
VVVREGATRSCRACSNRLADQTCLWFASNLSREDWPDFVFAFHDDDEIGPRMLARIAKKTGLIPEDL